MERVPNLDAIKSVTLNCRLCQIKFKSENEKFADHDHLTGKFRQIICCKCNSKLRVNRWSMPILLHNYKNYDSHVLCISAFGKMKGWNFAVIPQTTEKYIATMADFEVGKRQGDGKAVRFTLSFLDSYQFLSAGLASLVEKLPRDRFLYY